MVDSEELNRKFSPVVKITPSNNDFPTGCRNGAFGLACRSQASESRKRRNRHRGYGKLCPISGSSSERGDVRKKNDRIFPHI